MQFRKIFAGILIMVLFVSGFQSTNVKRAVAAPLPPIVIDHNSIALYDQIPVEYLRAAEALRFTFMDRSVGSNINDGLSCLAAGSWSASPANCRRSFTDSSLTNWKTFNSNDSNVPSDILFPGGNNRSNIDFVFGSGTWEEDLAAYIAMYPNYADRDIFSLQHNYLHVSNGSNIDDVYFDPNYAGTNIFDVLELETRYPDNIFVYWTTSLARTVGTQDAQSFNDQMRSWTASNGKILLDVADIESHAPDGSVCRNDLGFEVICKNYTTETSGGHLGSVSDGKIRIAKAIWVMLARVSGWVPGSLPAQTSLPIPSATPTNQTTAQPTITPTTLPTISPTTLPTSETTLQPTTQPTSLPTTQPTIQPTLRSNLPATSPDRKIIIDQNSVALYNQIPDQYLRAAEQLRILFMDRSVGSNINDGLTCLSYSNWISSPSHCRRAYIDNSLTNWKTFTGNDLIIPEEIFFQATITAQISNTPRLAVPGGRIWIVLSRTIQDIFKIEISLLSSTIICR